LNNITFAILIVIGCFNSNGSAEYKPGQIWTEKHIRYQCSREGMTRVLGEFKYKKIN